MADASGTRNRTRARTLPSSIAGASASSLSVRYTGPARPVIAMFTITSDHSPLDNSASAWLRCGTIRTCQPSESSTCRSADWLASSSSMIRIPIFLPMHAPYALRV